MDWKSKIDTERLPKHVAVIMDGNGRWAKQKGKIPIHVCRVVLLFLMCVCVCVQDAKHLQRALSKNVKQVCQI